MWRVRVHHRWFPLTAEQRQFVTANGGVCLGDRDAQVFTTLRERAGDLARTLRQLGCRAEVECLGPVPAMYLHLADTGWQMRGGRCAL